MMSEDIRGRASGLVSGDNLTQNRFKGISRFVTRNTQSSKSSRCFLSLVLNMLALGEFLIAIGKS